MNYKELRKINVNDHIEKKNGLSYLSWAWAVDELLQHDQSATWSYGDPMVWGETVMVFCTVKAFGKEMTAQLPVMDYRNKAIPNPDAMAVNTAMQRCLAKAIALHGIGLYIYAGEDIPEQDTMQESGPITPTTGSWESVSTDMQIYLKELAAEMAGDIEQGNVQAAIERVELAKLETHHKVALWTRFDSKQRAAMKKQMETTGVKI